jgi:hypothetical protein
LKTHKRKSLSSEPGFRYSVAMTASVDVKLLRGSRYDVDYVGRHLVPPDGERKCIGVAEVVELLKTPPKFKTVAVATDTDPAVDPNDRDFPIPPELRPAYDDLDAAIVAAGLRRGGSCPTCGGLGVLADGETDCGDCQ